MQASSRRAVYLAAIALAVVLSTAIKLRFAGARELWLDETYSAYLAVQPWSKMLEFTRGDVHPPLYYILLKLWACVFSSTPISLRMFSLVTNLCSIPLFFHLATALLRRRWTTVYTFFLFLFSPAILIYAVEVRMYMLAMLFTLAASAVFLRASEHSRPRDWIGFSCLSALAFYSHYLSIFVTAAHLAAGLVTRSTGARFRAVLLASGLFGLLVTPWLPTTAHQWELRTRQDQVVAASRLEPTALNFVGDRPIPDTTLSDQVVAYAAATASNLASLAGLFPASHPLLTVLLALPFALCILWFFCHSTRRNRKATLLATILATATAGLLVAGFGDERRYLFLLAPYFVLIFGITFDEATLRASLRPFAIGLMVAIGVVYVAGAVRIVRRDYCQPLSTLVEAITSKAGAGDIILFHAPYLEIPFRYYAGELSKKFILRGFPLEIESWWQAQPFRGWGAPMSSTAELKQFSTSLGKELKTRGLWLVQSDHGLYDPGSALLASLRTLQQAERTELDFAQCHGADEMFRAYSLWHFQPQR